MFESIPCVGHCSGCWQLCRQNDVPPPSRNIHTLVPGISEHVILYIQKGLCSPEKERKLVLDYAGHHMGS